MLPATWRLVKVARSRTSSRPRSLAPSARIRDPPRVLRLRLLTLLALACVLSCGPKPTSEPWGDGVLVIAIDGLRADHLSCAGYDRPTTPVIDALARQGTLFSNAWSAAPRLVPSHAALLTGCDPWIARRPTPAAHDERDPLAWRIPDAAPRLAQELLAHGYATAAFVSDSALSPVCGFGAGFQEFRGPEHDELGEQALSLDEIGTRFVNWLTDLSAKQDWFAYLHVSDLVRLWSRPGFDPQWDTFFPPRPELSAIPPVAADDDEFFAVPRSRWSGATLSVGEYEARYDGALKALDTRLSQLLERLRRTPRLKNTTIVLVGTFGTSFGESGLYLGSGTLSDADLHVPLIVRPRLTAKLPINRTLDTLVSAVDVAPTVLALEGLALPQGVHGVSLAPLLRDTAQSLERTAVFATGGAFPGWVAIDARHCFESIQPQHGASAVAVTSWTGEALAGIDTPVRQVLHDRRDGRKGHLGLPGAETGDVRVRGRLSAAGEAWYASMERERRALGTIAERDPAR